MKYIIGNWKMNGSIEELQRRIEILETVKTDHRVIICPPFTMLNVKSDRIELGAQDISMHDHGSYTGEVSGQMIAQTGAKYVIVGHSERRKYHNETNEMVRAKAEQAIANGLIPIICIGETVEEKNAGKTAEIIERDLRGSMPTDVKSEIMVAYEPRWAIGTGVIPTITDIGNAHKLIADILESIGLGGTAILYGGSVNAENGPDIMATPNVDGALIGTSFLKMETFVPIIESVE